MPISKKYLAEFRENQKYHIYNRTNNKERLFRSDENHKFFLKKYNEHLSAYLDTYCWCLLPNHFHLLIKTRSESVILERLKTRPENERSHVEQRFIEGHISLNKLIVHAFKRFFQSYSQSFNKVQKRSGNLFYTPFKRVLLEQEADFKRTILYIHRNPVMHGVIMDFTEYRWSSWKNYSQNDMIELLFKEVIDLFGSKEHFIRSHLGLINSIDETDFLI